MSLVESIRKSGTCNTPQSHNCIKFSKWASVFKSSQSWVDSSYCSCVRNVASVGWSCFPHLNVFLHWPLWSTTEAHKSAFKLCSFERKCHPHTKTLASGGDLGVGLWQLRGSPWEPARFNHRARETHSGSCCMEWRRLLGLITEQLNRLWRTFSDKSRNWFHLFLWRECERLANASVSPWCQALICCC